jgi:hypothetical protein
MFFPVKHCFFRLNIVFWEKTLFETANTLFFGFKQCVSRKTMFERKKQCFRGPGRYSTPKWHAGRHASSSQGDDASASGNSKVPLQPG